MSKVCVTGGAGYIGSWLVKKLLDRGCTVHTTLRDLGDEKKTGLLRAFAAAAPERLVLFEADIYDAGSFEPAIAGCEFVFLVATPLQHTAGTSKYKDTTEALVDATRAILQQCERAKTVRRVIHTGSVLAAAPLREDGSGFKDFANESCWTPLGLQYDHSNEIMDAYIPSKTLSEKELLKHNSEAESKGFDVVVLLCGLVGGDTLLPYVPASMQVVISPLTGIGPYHGSLKFMQALLGSVPLVHVDDVCEAHIFCMDSTKIAAGGGRFFCATAQPNMEDIVKHYAAKHPELKLLIKEVNNHKLLFFLLITRNPIKIKRCLITILSNHRVVGEGVSVQANTNKLAELGFEFKYGAEEVLDGSVECGKRLGLL